ncbi:bacillithiol biosynthesis deacetylase BshB2 [Paenibacillus sp. 19GGS1-52]|uniref:bacillithiol biosynthesis deacetylase BshB2 n=1 Tax=Paenibacillus sp. 19GGS1-52 TaxID=2758563 RepID=UPI001EFB9719|nr:bacillithiol biosynthesis deacetylase BshB2 [Paenibacillus sp. 19GGS1-52]ULO04934.1 bacillithiol biosynthesis deacetylase BshB2 [Paenibacillus sp. 19GGS1-52]
MNTKQVEHQNILVVFPHPDDEAFLVSGTLAMYIQEGAKVTYACLTLGEMGRNMGIPPFANRVTLPAIRKEELVASCHAIGIQDLRMLGFHDKMIEFEDQQLLDGQIMMLLKELTPSLVITFYPGFSVHPDHDATGAAVIRTITRLPAAERPLVHSIAFSSNHEQVIGKADVTIDVTAFLAKKMESIQSHRSQFQAAELVGERELNDEEIRNRFGTEQFWTYRFD